MPVPTLIQDIHAGREAFARDLDLALKGTSPSERGWAMPDDLTLLVPLFAYKEDGTCDAYLLKLHFDYYASGPPSAQFVNPETLAYTHPGDIRWVPHSQGHAAIAFHTNYDNQGQLICSSTTLEFYKVNHSVEERNIWRHGEMTFMSTIAAIKSGLSAPYYKHRSVQ